MGKEGFVSLFLLRRPSLKTQKKIREKRAPAASAAPGPTPVLLQHRGWGGSGRFGPCDVLRPRLNIWPDSPLLARAGRAPSVTLVPSLPKTRWQHQPLHPCQSTEPGSQTHQCHLRRCLAPFVPCRPLPSEGRVGCRLQRVSEAPGAALGAQIPD